MGELRVAEAGREVARRRQKAMAREVFINYYKALRRKAKCFYLYKIVKWTSKRATSLAK